jgi:molybdenum cofactor cytidylyltransferase
MAEIWAIILAAGKSERMGSNKLLMPYSDRTIIETVIGNAMQSDVDNIIVVLGAYRNELLPVINPMKVNHCYNEHWENGMMSSVRCGFKNLPAEADAALIVLGDQPGIPGRVVSSLIREFRQNTRGIVIPVNQGKRGHPVLISRSYEEEIMQPEMNKGLRELMHRHAGDVLEVETDVQAVLKDIDTIQDFLAISKLN